MKAVKTGTIPPVPTRKQLMKRGIRILVDVPKERNIRDVPFYNFWQIAKRGWDLVPKTYGRTDANRNGAAKFFLENPQYTHLCMLDCDHAHPEDIVERLGRWVMQDKSRLVVAGLNYRRTPPFDPCMFTYGEDGKLHPPLEWDNGLISVDATGTGCILIAREVFEKTAPKEQGDAPWFAYGYNWAYIDVFPSEDMFFAQLCRANGFQQWVDTTTTSPHMGDLYIHEGHFRQFIAQNPDHVRVLGQDRQRAEKILAGEAELL